MLSNDVAKEVLIISSYLNCIKIPDNIFNRIVELASKSLLNVKIDLKKTLLEQDLSEECLDFISLFYYENCDASKKEELFKYWEENMYES